jgi:hypothetical protein
MKQIKLFLAIIMLASFSTANFAQTASKDSKTPKTEKFKVYGECGMCKSRIEKTVKAEGAISANWVEKSKMLTVTFDPAKTNVEALGKKLALAGHDTEKYKATDEAYEKLPGCCHYERAK